MFLSVDKTRCCSCNNICYVGVFVDVQVVVKATIAERGNAERQLGQNRCAFYLT